MSLIKQFAGQAVIYGIGTILSRVVYFLLVSVFLTRLLEEPVQFGVYAKFYAYAAVLVTLFSFRFDTALFRYGNKNEDLDRAFNTALTPVLIGAIILFILGYFFCEPIAALIQSSGKPEYVRWFAYIMAFDVINLLPFAKLRLQSKAKSFALYKLANVFLSVILILFFLLVLPKHQAGLFSFLPQRSALIDWVFIANLIASGILFISLFPVYKSFRFHIDLPLLKKMVVYILPLVLVGMANGLIQFFAVPLQEFFLDGKTAENNLGEGGIYDATRRIAGLLIMFTTAFNYAAEPFFFNNSSASDRKAVYGKICRLFTLVGGLMVVGMVLSQDLLKYLLGANYRGDMQLLPVLLMAYLLLGIYYNVSIWYKLSDKTWYGAFISLVGVILTFAISICFLPQIGTAASAWSTLVSYLVMVILGYIIGQKIYPIDYPVKKILMDLLIITLVLGTAALIRNEASIVIKYISYLILGICFLGYVWKVEEKEWKKLLGQKMA